MNVDQVDTVHYDQRQCPQLETYVAYSQWLTFSEAELDIPQGPVLFCVNHLKYINYKVFNGVYLQPN